MDAKIKIPESALILMSIIPDSVVVGGCVRDQLLGIKPKDWDIASPNAPSKVMKMLSENNIPFRQVGACFGVVVAIVGGESFEISTFRQKESRLTAFSCDIEEDLSRRDFTIDAIAYSPDEGIIDPFNGVRDLESGLIKAVGDPDMRFSEDALRMLRGIRFAAKYGFEFDRGTLESLLSNSYALGTISKERISNEVSKILLCKDPSMFFLCDMHQSIGLCESFDDIDEFVSRFPRDLNMRLAAAMYETPLYAAVNNLKRLKFSNDDIFEVQKFLELKDAAPFSIIEARRLISKYDSKTIERACDFWEASDVRSGGNAFFASSLAATACSEAREKKTEWKISGLAINGHDLMEAGFSGREIGRGLRVALDAVIEERVNNERSELLNEVKNACEVRV